MARDVAAMFDELRRLADRHAELSADRARLEAEVGARLEAAAASRMADEANRRAADLADRLAASIEEKAEALKALEAERRRPWWRRLIGR